MAKKVQKISETINQLRKKNTLLIVALGMLAILVIFSIVLLASQSQRSAIYRNSSGAAGLTAAIDYNCSDPCDNKYNFNVYILTPDGRQVSAVQPSSDGEVRLALAEGNYVMLIGRLFGDKDIFPQEPLELKNGKTLEMKLQY